MDRRDAFEKSWAARRRVSIDEIRAHRFETEDGYDLPSLAAHYRTWCAALDMAQLSLNPLQAPPIGPPDNRCLACGGYHWGISGLPCPVMRITASGDKP